MPATPEKSFAFDRRSSGLLLHPTSLPGPAGSGDIGLEAFRFIDFLTSAKQRWWQMLPVSPPGDGDSPYSSYSLFAGSPWLISLDRLPHGLLHKKDLSRPSHRRDHAGWKAFHISRLRTAFDRLRSGAELKRLRDEFEEFRKANRSWLDDYTLFSALKESRSGQSWALWPGDLKLRNPAALRSATAKLHDEMAFHAFVQFLFERQWRALRKYANERGIGLIGDIPIFVAYDSVDVWANSHLFLLDRSRRPTVLSGCPPDAFSADGQLWGHPHYDWRAHARENFAWWIGRFRSMLQRFDAVRIDHFLGFHQFWAVPARAKTARGGRYMPGPRARFFEALHDALGDVPIIAEDLGAITPEALALRDQFDLPGMRVLQFGFGPGGDYHLPHRYTRRSVAYVGTHDNDTATGWYAGLRRRKDAASRTELRKVNAYLQPGVEPLHHAMTRTLMQSVADTVIVQVQDVLGLGGESRMNVPGVARGNWRWRLKPDALTPAVASTLRDLAQVYDRA